MGKILGLDVGIGSLGWAVIDEDQHRIVDFGVTVNDTKYELSFFLRLITFICCCIWG